MSTVKVWWGPLNIEVIWWPVTMHYDFEIVFYSIARKNLYCKESSRSFNLRSKFHFSKVFTCNASQAFTISKLVGKRIRLTTTWLRLYIIIYFCNALKIPIQHHFFFFSDFRYLSSQNVFNKRSSLISFIKMSSIATLKSGRLEGEHITDTI